MIVQHIIWFLFNFRSKNSKISKISFFLAFFSENEKSSEICQPKSKGGHPLRGSKTILYLKSSKVLRDKKRFKLIESNVIF